MDIVFACEYTCPLLEPFISSSGHPSLSLSPPIIAAYLIVPCSKYSLGSVEMERKTSTVGLAGLVDLLKPGLLLG